MVTEQQYRETLQRILDILNTRNWDALANEVDDLFIADYMRYLPGLPEPMRGVEAWKESMRIGLEFIPDYHATIEDVFVAGDKAVVRLLLQRTDPDTGKSQHAMDIMISYMEDGKFAKEWQVLAPWEDDV